MSLINRREPFWLFLGDLSCFLAALWLMLVARYLEIPSRAIFLDHLKPFAILFAFWVLFFFIAGLYERHTLILQNKLPGVILNTLTANILLAVVFFYFIPYFGITPKINLFIYLVTVFVLLLLWRLKGQQLLNVRERQKAVIVGSGKEMKELKQEVNNNSRYGLQFISSVDLDEMESLDFQEEVLKLVYAEGVSVIAIDLRNEKVEPILPNLYNLIFSKVKFVDLHKIYEDIFNRVPLSLVRHNWFLENISAVRSPTFDFLKRLTDLFLSSLFGIISLTLYPLVFLAIKLDDGGPLFFVQRRVGKNNKIVKLVKFRSMSEDVVQQKKVTRVGHWLRRWRLDELPQLWNVLIGDLSLIGPRPEIPELVRNYENKISYYNIRHLVKPGLSGWAQLYHQTPPKFNADYDETKTKLSYDLYYLKNRSLILDFKITLKTIKTLILSNGS